MGTVPIWSLGGLSPSHWEGPWVGLQLGGLELGYRATSRCAVRPRSSGQPPGSWTVVTPPGSLIKWCCSRTKAKWGWSWVDKGWGCFQVCNQDHSKPTTWAWTCLLRTALHRLGFHWDFASSYLDSKVLAKALLFVVSCQIIVAVGIQVGDLLFGPPSLPSGSLDFLI